MTQETINKVSEKVKEAIGAPSCCAELKSVGQEWLDAVGTDKISDATKKLLQELEEDVCALDDTMAFFDSPAGKEYFGEERAAEMVKKSQEAKANGVKYCICGACTAGGAILDMKAELA